MPIVYLFAIGCVDALLFFLLCHLSLTFFSWKVPKFYILAKHVLLLWRNKDPGPVFVWNSLCRCSLFLSAMSPIPVLGWMNNILFKSFFLIKIQPNVRNTWCFYIILMSSLFFLWLKGHFTYSCLVPLNLKLDSKILV